MLVAIACAQRGVVLAVYEHVGHVYVQHTRHGEQAQRHSTATQLHINMREQCGSCLYAACNNLQPEHSCYIAALLL
jgi:hypothetical protein